MKIYRNKNLSEQTFVIEENSFFDCTLKDCDLFFSGGDFQLVNVKLEGSRIHFRGSAKNTIALMQTVGMIQGPIPLPPQVQTGQTKAN